MDIRHGTRVTGVSRRNLLLGFGAFGFGALLTPIARANAATTTKDFLSPEALQAGIDAANEGDVLTLAPGTYSNAQFTLSRNGITVCAKVPGTVIFKDAVQVLLKSDFSIFTGFQFIGGQTPGTVIKVIGSHNQVNDLNFSNYSAEKYITIGEGSQFNDIAFCNFENKPVTAPVGNLVGVIPNAAIPGYHRIRFCSFKNLPGDGGDFGNEPIRLGLGITADFISRTTVEKCYWENTGSGDSECISIKSRENVIRNCTFNNNKDGMLVFRNGNDNMAYGNVFLNSGGIRVKEASNIFCFANYFENSGVGGRAGSVVYDHVPGNLQNLNFLFNTFVNCAPITLGTNPSPSNTWANNVFSNKTGSVLLDTNTGIRWLGNIYQGSLGTNSFVGMKVTVLKFAKKLNDLYRPSATSPSRSSAVTGYSLPTMFSGLLPLNPLERDLEGNPRPSNPRLWDTGAIQYSKNPLSSQMPTAQNTGPRY